MSKTTLAAGFLIDTNLIGVTEATRRVIEHWQDGARLHTTPEGNWLLALANPVTIRLDRAPGLALPRSAVADAATLPLSDVEILINLPVYALEPIETAPPPEILASPAPVEAPDLRSAAKIGPPPRSRRIDRGQRPAAALDAVWRVGLIIVVSAAVGISLVYGVTLISPVACVAGFVGLIGVIVNAWRSGREAAGRTSGGASVGTSGGASVGTSRVGTSRVGTSRVGASAVRGAAVGASAVRGAAVGTSHVGISSVRTSSVRTSSVRTSSVRTSSGAARMPRSGRLRARLAAIAFASPFGHLLARRHLAYLKRVERAFRERDWERALREAIRLGGKGGILSMSLPKAWRGQLSPSLIEQSGGRGLGIAGIDTVFTDIYRKAAAELEQAGQVEKAAYVLADLLGSPADAVQMLERHKMYLLAAQLAEGRRLEAALVVRLWWRAGERQRAVDVARLRGAFAAALDRLGDSDHQLALQLRTAWVESRREAGDHLGALAAAWPDPRLHEAAVPDLQHAMALGGPAAAHALAYLLNLHSDTQARDAARALVSSQDPALKPAQDRFLTAFASVAAGNSVHDRQIATAASVAMTRNGVPKSHQKAYDSLSKRADPVTVADLPKPRALPKTLSLNHTFAPTAPGDLPVHDAAWIGGRLLLAHGGHGVRLVRPDGRQVARWDVPAHRLTVADSGTRVMLIAAGRHSHEFHELDLATRRIRRWAALRVSAVASTYDGDVLTVTDEDGIAFLATNEAKPRVIWRELDRQHPVVLLERSPAGISALIRSPAAHAYELWSWHAPAALLRQRPAVDLTGVLDAAILAGGHIVVRSEEDVRLLQNGQRRKHLAPATPGTALMASGDSYALIEPGDGQIRVTLRRDIDPQPLARLDMPQPPAGMRATQGRVVLWSHDARVLALDLDRSQVDADFRTVI